MMNSSVLICVYLWFNSVVTIHILNGFSKSLPWSPYQRIGAVCLLVETNQGLPEIARQRERVAQIRKEAEAKVEELILGKEKLPC